MFVQTLIMFFSLVMLKAGSKKEVTVTFKPEEAKVTVSTAIFKFKEGEKIT